MTCHQVYRCWQFCFFLLWFSTGVENNVAFLSLADNHWTWDRVICRSLPFSLANISFGFCMILLSFTGGADPIDAAWFSPSLCWRHLISFSDTIKGGEAPGFHRGSYSIKLILRVGVTQILYMTTLLPSLSYHVSWRSHVIAACSHTGNVSQFAFDRLLCPHQQSTLSGASCRNMFHSSTQEKTLKFLASLGLGWGAPSHYEVLER